MYDEFFCGTFGVSTRRMRNLPLLVASTPFLTDCLWFQPRTIFTIEGVKCYLIKIFSAVQ